MFWALIYISLSMGVEHPKIHSWTDFPDMNTCFVAREIVLEKFGGPSSQAVCIPYEKGQSL